MKSVGLLANSGWWPLFRRYAQFCIVGGSGVVVDMGIIWLLADQRTLGWNLTVSKIIAAEVAIFNNFLWNDIWTFRGLGAERTCWLPRLIRLGRFNLICAAGIALSVLLLNVQVYWLQMNVYLANFISIVLVSLWNFFMNLKFGWNAKAKPIGQLNPARPLR
jgi:dolichol-phosphate mannosyltransferase